MAEALPLRPFRIDLLAGADPVGSYVVHAATILDVIGRGSPLMFDRKVESSITEIRITPVPPPD